MRSAAEYIWSRNGRASRSKRALRSVDGRRASWLGQCAPIATLGRCRHGLPAGPTVGASSSGRGQVRRAMPARVLTCPACQPMRPGGARHSRQVVPSNPVPGPPSHQRPPRSAGWSSAAPCGTRNEWSPPANRGQRPVRAGGPPEAPRAVRTGPGSPCTTRVGRPASTGSSLGPGLLRPARRVQREGQGEHADGAELRGGTAGHPGPGAAAADDQRCPDRPAPRAPPASRVERRRRAGHPAPATRHGCSTRSTVTPRAGSAAASAARSAASMPPPAPWPSARVRAAAGPAAR